MCCGTLLGFIVGVVVFKIFRRWAAWRFGHGGGSCHHRGSGCGGHGRGYNRWSNYGPGHGAWDRGGAAQGSDFGASTSAGGSSGSSGGADNSAASAAAATGRPIDDLVRVLELNQRQKDEALPVLSLIKQRLGVLGPRVELALSVIASDRFAPEPLIAQLGDLPDFVQGELIDALEHLHTILISEQREALRKELQRR
jgi:hypothetical protein